ncbi:RNA polymerase sigma factor [Chitinophaga pinensis]|uniref:RNA polymerase sigma factor n=1 Tax=Chitinophaga pinensis TaxID=79329 RepID=UPI001651799B|nr:sigma-70 family RNA polymerase sigma factor [Chitinophaga pinensis]
MKKNNNLYQPGLVQRLKKDDESALRELITHLTPTLVSDALAVLSDRQEAEDVVQNVLINFWRVKMNLASDLDCRVYLRRAVRYVSVAAVRSKMARSKRHQHYFYSKDKFYARLPLENKELLQQIVQAIGRLPPAVRHSFSDMYLHGKSHKEIATEHNISRQTVKNNISQALKFLRVHLKHLLQ